MTELHLGFPGAKLTVTKSPSVISGTVSVKANGCSLSSTSYRAAPLKAS